MLKVISDVLLAVDRGEVTLLCLLDLFAAFHTVDHDILIDRLLTLLGIWHSWHSTVMDIIIPRRQNTDSYSSWIKVEHS